MSREFSRKFFPVGALVALCLILQFAPSAPGEPPDETAARGKEQSYVGSNQCFVCHRPQTNTWHETKHVHAFTNMPERYQNDPACLKCHVTGFGQAGGYVAGTDKDLMHVGCEACHGPGALHVSAAQRFILATPDEEAEIEKELRETIVRMPTDSVCAACHITQAHQRHPAYAGQPAAQLRGRTVAPCNPAVSFGQHSTASATPTRNPSRYSIKTCGGCHYDQYRQWQTEKHADLSAMLPAKYRNDQNCRDCHPPAGEAGKILALDTDPHHTLIGVACESCHGPAFEHVRFTRRFIAGPPLGPKLEAAARDSISKGKPDAMCIQCHIGERHQEHPEFEED